MNKDQGEFYLLFFLKRPGQSSFICFNLLEAAQRPANPIMGAAAA
jgi:hypothetical protein